MTFSINSTILQSSIQKKKPTRPFSIHFFPSLLELLRFEMLPSRYVTLVTQQKQLITSFENCNSLLMCIYNRRLNECWGHTLVKYIYISFRNMSTFATLLCVCLVFINTVQAFNLRFKREDNYCYSKDPEHYVYASTLTGYEFVRKDVRNLQIPRGRFEGVRFYRLKKYDLPACRPVMFWHLNRHGTRYPSESEIKTFSKLKDTLAQVQENVKQGRGELCEEDYKLLQT